MEEKYNDGLREFVLNTLGETFGVQVALHRSSLTAGSIIGNPLYIPHQSLNINVNQEAYLIKSEQALGKWAYYDFYRNNISSGYELHEIIGGDLNLKGLQQNIKKSVFRCLFLPMIKTIGGSGQGRLETCTPYNIDDRRLIIESDTKDYISRTLPVRRWHCTKSLSMKEGLELGFVRETTYKEAFKYVQRSLGLLVPRVNLDFYNRDLEELGVKDQTIYQVTPKGHCFICPEEINTSIIKFDDTENNTRSEDSLGGVYS